MLCVCDVKINPGWNKIDQKNIQFGNFNTFHRKNTGKRRVRERERYYIKEWVRVCVRKENIYIKCLGNKFYAEFFMRNRTLYIIYYTLIYLFMLFTGIIEKQI